MTGTAVPATPPSQAAAAATAEPATSRRTHALSMTTTIRRFFGT
jgi:hypothetical protein